MRGRLSARSDWTARTELRSGIAAAYEDFLKGGGRDATETFGASDVPSAGRFLINTTTLNSRLDESRPKALVRKSQVRSLAARTPLIAMRLSAVRSREITFPVRNTDDRMKIPDLVLNG
jgi:hypothetical protein